jgi:hypothetical protein
MSRRQKPIKEFEFTKPIKIQEPNMFAGKPGDDFEHCGSWYRSTWKTNQRKSSRTRELSTG